MDNRGKRQAASIFGGMGFYIALLVCVVAAGVVGYFALLKDDPKPVEDPVPSAVSEPEPAQSVTAPEPEPARPVIKETPVIVENPTVRPILEEEPDEPEFTVRVTPFEREGSNMVGLASIVLNDSFAVGNVSVVEGKNGMFVAMPSYKAGNRYRDVCFPITKEFREKLNDAVLETYQQAKEQAVQEGKERASQQMQTDDRGFMKASGEPLPFR